MENNRLVYSIFFKKNNIYCVYDIALYILYILQVYSNVVC